MGGVAESIGRCITMIQRLVTSAKADWPLALLFIGLPLWWLLGVWKIMFFVMAVPMAVYLMKQRVVQMPRGFGMWLLWLGWVLTGILVLQVDVPGTLLGAESSRYLTFGYRFGWYVIATIAALYVLNTRSAVSSERITRAVAWLFVMVVAGGLLGLLVPNFSMASALEALLPHSIASQPFVHDLVHVQVAQIQNFLGYDEARPSAPFPYTNDWGLAVAVSLPFFIAAWSKRGRGWRIGMVVVLVFALWTIIFSLNRGMWAAILSMAAFLVLRSVMLGRLRILFASAVFAIGVGMILMFSPLGELVLERFANPHSDEGRSNLSLMGVESVLGVSPVVGFGTTRNVPGNFSSIAGGASDLCPSCSPPPLGTHGQLWLVLFGAGLIGVVIYFGFLLSTLMRSIRTASAPGIAALCALISIVVTMTVYNSNEVALYVTFIGIGLLAREHAGDLPTLRHAIRPARQFFPVLMIAALLGAGIGASSLAYAGPRVEATQRLLVPVADFLGIPGARPLSLDGEALIATSEPVVRAVARALDVSEAEARRSLQIGAEPNTRVLLVSYQSASPSEAARGAEVASNAYLRQREALISRAKTSLEERYGDRGAALDAVYSATRPLADTANSGFLWDTVQEIRDDRSAVGRILLESQSSASGQTIAAAAVHYSDSSATIRIASGLALGFLGGLLLVLLHDRYFLRVGYRPDARLAIDVPVIAWVSPNDVAAARRAVMSYLPVAGVLADPDSTRARKLASGLDDVLNMHGSAGSRALMIINPRSRATAVRRAYEHYLRVGVHPVGLIMCAGARRRHRIGRRASSRRRRNV